MCKFRVTVTLCGCCATYCMQRPSDLGQLDSEVMQDEGGHVYKINTYFRDGPMCIDGYFVNNDPNRLVVKKYGMDPNNPNSKQDCKNRTFIIDSSVQRLNVMCDDCKNFCMQPPIIHPIGSFEWAMAVMKQGS